MLSKLVPTSLVLLAHGVTARYSSIRHQLQPPHVPHLSHRNAQLLPSRDLARRARNLRETHRGPENCYYSHSSLLDQLSESHQVVRSLELDLHSDEKGGLYYSSHVWTLFNLTNATTPYDGSVLLEPGINVFHVTGFDMKFMCHTFVDCLTHLRERSANKQAPTSYPCTVDLELKTETPACRRVGYLWEDGFQGYGEWSN
ncbi:hypothetical protein PMIN04_012357 [Paraphaeosphaeria minitans]|uniref:Acid phosphatase n=1 Tax=Paraphaeosphaeria minitans TaxID=565426 RepID=A0A9P6KQN6_9PLEO|nr:acid phosphatase [Paraphaeosphaeria minitans]